MKKKGPSRPEKPIKLSPTTNSSRITYGIGFGALHSGQKYPLSSGSSLITGFSSGTTSGKEVSPAPQSAQTVSKQKKQPPTYSKRATGARDYGKRQSLDVKETIGCKVISMPHYATGIRYLITTNF